MEQLNSPEEKKTTENIPSLQTTPADSASPNSNPKRSKIRFHPRNLQQLKLFNQKEKNWLNYLIRNRIPLLIRKIDGSLLENLILLNFDAEESRQIACEKEGSPLHIPKIDCVFLAQMEHRSQILERIKKDEKQLPRLTYKTPEGEERWLFPQTETLMKMKKNRGGVFILNDGFMYRGRLYWFTRWNLFLSLAQGCEVLLFKHACRRWSILSKKPNTRV